MNSCTCRNKRSFTCDGSLIKIIPEEAINFGNRQVQEEILVSDWAMIQNIQKTGVHVLVIDITFSRASPPRMLYQLLEQSVF